MDEKSLLIAKKVIFDSAKMTLTNGDKIIKISESETNLLLAFYRGIYKKEDIINFVWKNRAGCVSESSYYKLINQMRNNFVLVGLNAADIVTRPRIGVSLSLALEPIKKNLRHDAKTSGMPGAKKIANGLSRRTLKDFSQNTPSRPDHYTVVVNGCCDAISACASAK